MDRYVVNSLPEFYMDVNSLIGYISFTSNFQRLCNPLNNVCRVFDGPATPFIYHLPRSYRQQAFCTSPLRRRVQGLVVGACPVSSVSRGL